MQLLTILQKYFSKWYSRSSYKYNLVKSYRLNLSYLLYPQFFLVSAVMTVTTRFSIDFYQLRVNFINLGTYCAALTSSAYGMSWFSMPLSRSTLYSSYSSQLSLLTSASSKQTGFHSNTMVYESQYVACHIREISTHLVHLFLLTPPVSDIWYPRCTANHLVVGV